jgi:predicted RNase H-like HicB family nuclease
METRHNRAREAVQVTATWDDEAGVWVAQSDDVPGLATEADTLDALDTKLRVMIPELLRENGLADGGPPEVPVELLARRSALYQMPAE